MLAISLFVLKLYRISGCLNGATTAEWVTAGPGAMIPIKISCRTCLGTVSQRFCFVLFFKSLGDSNVRPKLRTTTIGSNFGGSHPSHGLWLWAMDLTFLCFNSHLLHRDNSIYVHHIVIWNKEVPYMKTLKLGIQ